MVGKAKTLKGSIIIQTDKYHPNLDCVYWLAPQRECWLVLKLKHPWVVSIIFDR